MRSLYLLPSDYRKVPKFSDARNLCCNLPKIQTKRPNLRVFCQNGANAVKTLIRLLLKEQSDLGLHCLTKLYVRKLRIITVMNMYFCKFRCFKLLRPDD